MIMKAGMLLVLEAVLAGCTASAEETREDQSPITTCTLKIERMTCGGCEGAVKVAAKRVDGVTAVTASYKTKLAQVTFDSSKTSPDAIARAITEKSGFKAEVVR